MLIHSLIVIKFLNIFYIPKFIKIFFNFLKQLNKLNFVINYLLKFVIIFFCEKMEEQIKKYTLEIEKRKSLLIKYEDLQKKIKKQEEYTQILKDILCRCKGEARTIIDKLNYPIILGSAYTRMAIDNLGELPTENLNDFHTEKYIFPINYTMRRKFLSHNSSQEKKEKISYTCKITENGFLIQSEDGYVYEGREGFENFKSNFDVEIGTIEEFFGFNNPTLQIYIETLGDVSVFKNYIPIKERKKNKN